MESKILDSTTGILDQLIRSESLAILPDNFVSNLLLESSSHYYNSLGAKFKTEYPTAPYFNLCTCLFLGCAGCLLMFSNSKSWIQTQIGSFYGYRRIWINLESSASSQRKSRLDCGQFWIDCGRRSWQWEDWRDSIRNYRMTIVNKKRSFRGPDIQ